MKPKVSIIIPLKKIVTWTREETIPQILKQSYKDFEIIVLPDRKTNLKFPKTKIISTWPKVGPADKRDIGVRNSCGDIIAFIDDDAYPSKNWLKNAVGYFKKNSICAVCGPGLTPGSDSLLSKVSGWMWASWLGSGGAGRYRCWPGKKRIVDDFPTFNLIVRKADYKKIGGFDSHFWPGEDSLPPDEEVLIVNQLENIERVKIGDLVDRHLKKLPVLGDEKSEMSYKNPENLAVLSFDSNFKIRTKPIKAFIRHKKSNRVYELKLSRGNTIKCTNSHSLFTFNKDGQIVSAKVEELEPGDLVVVPRKIVVLKNVREINVVRLLLDLEDGFIWSGKFSLLYLRSKSYISYLSEHYKGKVLKAISKYNLGGNLSNWKYYGCLPLIVLKNLPTESYHPKLLKKFKVKIGARGHGNAARMKSIINVSEDLLWFLGFMTAEGWMNNPDKTKGKNKWGVSLSQKRKNRIFLDRSLKVLENHLGLSFSLYRDKRYDVLNIIVNCQVLWCFLRALGLGGYSYQKRVPPFIFSLSKRKIRAFLDGYHAGDSCDYTDGRVGKFGITTSSPEMVKDFALLFLRLGEPFRITKHEENRKPHYHDQYNIHAFCPSVKELGINVNLKMSSNLQDGIPAIDYLLKIARKYHLISELRKRGVAPQYTNKRDNRKKVSWHHVGQFLKVAKEKISNVPEVKNLEKILNSDLRFEEILEIKKVKKQPRYTYDLSVGGSPESDNFIAGSFVCVHNTKLCHDLVYKLGKKIVYDPKVVVYHHRRDIFSKHLKQAGRYGLHRGYFVKILPKTSKRLGYFGPMVFSFGLVLGPLTWIFLKFVNLNFLASLVGFLYLFSLAVYGGLLLYSGIWVFSKSKSVLQAVLTIPTIFITHLFYGLMFTKGISKKTVKSKYSRDKL